MVKKLTGLTFIKNLLKFAFAHKKLTLLLIVIFIISIYFLIPKQKSEILTQEVLRTNLVKTVSVTGDVSSDSSVNLSFQTPEILSYVGVKLGDQVKKGQEIAAIDSEKLAATVRQTQQDFIAAKAASEKYYDGHKNDTESFDEKVQRTAVDDAQNKAYDQYLKAQYDFNHSSIYAPFDGIITRLDADSIGENVNSQTIFTVTDPSSLNFKMDVDQADIGKITLGQPVDISLDSFPDKTIKLKVSSIDFVSHKTSSGGNAFYVKTLFSDPKNLRIGMSGNADIIVSSKINVLTIPTSSIVDGYVFVKDNKNYRKVKIVTGLDNDIDVEVVSGLKEGDIVALDSSAVPQNLIIK